jgi:uncharacterized protein (TIGR02284 family)
MRRERSIEILNGLIKVNDDRISCYERAYKETGETELRSLFLELRNCGLACKEQLISQILKSGGEPVSETKKDDTNKLMYLITGGDSNVILGTCEFGEDQAASKYYQTLRDHVKEITTEQQGLLNSQFALIRSNLARFSDPKLWRNSYS